MYSCLLYTSPYAKKSYDKYHEEFLEYTDASWSGREERAEKYAWEKVCRDCDQGWQGIEYKLNTVGSSRGDYPFVTVTLGLGTSRFEKMISVSLLNVHKEGQGKKGHKKPVLFPKIVFLYDKNIHDPGCECEDVFEAGVACSAKTMYPDWLSMSGEGYISSMYKKYKKVISPMGCRAFLSPWYERGGIDVYKRQYGRYDNSVIQSVYACGYYPVCWSVDTMDWKNYGEQDIRCV